MMNDMLVSSFARLTNVSRLTHGIIFIRLHGILRDQVPMKN